MGQAVLAFAKGRRTFSRGQYNELAQGQNRIENSVNDAVEKLEDQGECLKRIEDSSTGVQATSPAKSGQT